MLADCSADLKPVAADTRRLSTSRGKIPKSLSTIAQEAAVVKGESSLVAATLGKRSLGMITLTPTLGAGRARQRVALLCEPAFRALSPLGEGWGEGGRIAVDVIAKPR
jgi:hypothetical protein